MSQEDLVQNISQDRTADRNRMKTTREPISHFNIFHVILNWCPHLITAPLFFQWDLSYMNYSETQLFWAHWDLCIFTLTLKVYYMAEKSLQNVIFGI